MRTIQEVTVQIGDRQYLIASDDDYLNHIKHGFEPEMVVLLRTLAADAAVALDVGANIGCTSLLLSQMAQSVHAFEPAPSTYAFLQRNVAQATGAAITTHNMGLGEAAGESTLTYSPIDRSGGFVSNNLQLDEGHQVEHIVIGTLDAFVQEHALERIEFIKLDVEGFEGYVLLGGEQTLRDHRPNLVLELNHWCLNAFQRTSIPDFFDQLTATFPILYAIDGTNYLDLHNSAERYDVMHHHIVHRKFPNIAAGFDAERFALFKQRFTHGYKLDLAPSALPVPEPTLFTRLRRRLFA